MLRTMKVKNKILNDDDFLNIISEVIGYKEENNNKRIYLEDFLGYFNVS
jgi:hypothetical protein